MQEAILPVAIRADAHGAAAAVAGALEGLSAERDSSGTWRLSATQQPRQTSPEGREVPANDPEVSCAGESVCSEDSAGNNGSSSSINCSTSSSTATVANEPAVRRVRVLRALAGECGAQDIQLCLDEEKRGGLLIAFSTSVSKEAKVSALAEASRITSSRA